MPGQWRWVAGLVGVVCLVVPVRASSLEWQEDLEFREAVKRIARVIKEKSAAIKAAVPTIKDPKVETEDPTLPGGAELGMEAALRQLLAQNDVQLAETAPLGLKVTYQIGQEPGRDDPDKIVPVLVLEFSVLGKGGAGGKYPHKIHRTGLILSAGEKPGQLIKPGEAQSAENHEENVKQVLAAPAEAAVEGGLTLAREGGPFALEVRVEGKAVEPKLSEGKFAYVELRKGQSFTLRLHNRSRYEAVASVQIDGIDVCHFSEEREKGGVNSGRLTFRPLWVVPAGKQAEIKGWHVTQAESEKFVVTEEKDSVRAKLGYNGVRRHCITATFFRCWEKGQEPPPDEPGGGKGPGAIGIGRGERVADRKELVEREVGREHSIVCVRYTPAK